MIPVLSSLSCSSHKNGTEHRSQPSLVKVHPPHSTNSLHSPSTTTPPPTNNQQTMWILLCDQDLSRSACSVSSLLPPRSHLPLRSLTFVSLVGRSIHTIPFRRFHRLLQQTNNSSSLSFDGMMEDDQTRHQSKTRHLLDHQTPFIISSPSLDRCWLIDQCAPLPHVLDRLMNKLVNPLFPLVSSLPFLFSLHPASQSSVR